MLIALHRLRNNFYVSSENMAEFKYLETTATNQKLIHEEITRKLNSDIA
jgi:hypothetical protein